MTEYIQITYKVHSSNARIQSSRNKQLFSDSSIIIALVLKGDNFYFAL